MLAVREDLVAPIVVAAFIRRRSAVHLVERTLPEYRHDRHVGRGAETLPEIEIRIAAARHREAVVERAHLFEQGAGYEKAVALEHAVEPIAFADEVTDFEQAVPVGGPGDAIEQRVFVRLVVALVDDHRLLTGTDVPLLGRDDCGAVGAEPGHAELEDARREHMSAVDHEGERASASDTHAAVQRVGRRRRRIVAKVEVTKFGPEALDQVADLFVVVRAVLDDDDLVVEVIDALLVRARQRMQRPGGLPAHVVEDDDDREIDGVARSRRRDRRALADLVRRGARGREHSRVLLSPRQARPTDSLHGLGEIAADVERVERVAAGLVGDVLDDDVPARCDSVIEQLEHRSGLRADTSTQAEERNPTDRRVGQGGRERALEEADPLVEQPEAGEGLAHLVEVGKEVVDPARFLRGAAVGRG